MLSFVIDGVREQRNLVEKKPVGVRSIPFRAHRKATAGPLQAPGSASCRGVCLWDLLLLFHAVPPLL